VCICACVCAVCVGAVYKIAISGVGACVCVSSCGCRATSNIQSEKGGGVPWALQPMLTLYIKNFANSLDVNV